MLTERLLTVNRDSQEFRLIERYFVNTGGRSENPASWNLQIFRIERPNDEKLWNVAGWNKKPKSEDNRRLLWHGTSLGSVQTILKEGLQDVRKIGGVYFSDTAQTR